MQFKPRPYQQECLDVIAAQPPGRYLVQMATGLGKTAVFTHIPHEGRMLILSHREELVRQPLKWFSCSTGIEQGRNRSDHTEQVVSACTASMVHRLDGYDPEEFGLIIVDECHHAGARSYKKILSHFKPDKLIGFTATPNRSDKVRLNDVFQKIIFQRDLRWAIENQWLCPVHCLRVEIGYDLSAVHIRNGDYAPGELEEAMDGTADAIAQAYQEYAKGATLIFAVSVAQCEEIAKRIPGAVAVTGQTKDRAAIIDAFTRREIPCIVNCMVFTEGTDMPLVETVIIARPTTSEALYTQMVGRGLRLHPEKEKLTLIDCVGVAGKLSLCTAPCLLGVDLENVPVNKRDKLEGDLFELPEKAAILSDCPQSWIKNVQVVDRWAKAGGYNLHDLNLFQCPDGRMQVGVLNEDGSPRTMTIPAPDALGNVTLVNGREMPMQQAIDLLYGGLQAQYSHCQHLWDMRMVRKWGKAPASDKQKAIIAKRCPELAVDELTKGEASMVLNGLKAHNWRWTG